jgi:hypothetical protein
MPIVTMIQNQRGFHLQKLEMEAPAMSQASA